MAKVAGRRATWEEQACELHPGGDQVIVTAYGQRQEFVFPPVSVPKT